MLMLHRSPYRCRGCHNRFYVFLAPEKALAEPVEEAAEDQEPEDRQPERENSETARNPDAR
jgi:hypothetical protein